MQNKVLLVHSFSPRTQLSYHPLIYQLQIIKKNRENVDTLKKIRRHTFCHWHHAQGITAAQTISASFFYCNVGDRVICLYCNLICQQWTLNINDLEEVHFTSVPQYSYIRSMLKRHQTNTILIINENYANNSNGQLQISNNLRFNKIVHTSAYHRNYTEISKRQESLPSVDDFVRVRFSYIGTKTILTCFYCDGSLQNWLS
ncbi:unnamed protein product [Adineta steineri]|uniref:Uncharacterized protein n=1 Tax=Adineta steineri TaxID=433720 RepID=A0A815HL41_9BILA|nr:unnamed protein product [Adineta steineri]CAF4075869.1 unnamed protein product [Adineta steineri]